jgi:hypothetical protein
LHVEARRRGRLVHAVLSPSDDAPLERVAAGDTLVLIGVERVAVPGQLALAARLAGAHVMGRDDTGREALAFVLPCAPRALVERGQLAPELAARLAAWSLVSPPLCDVRQRIPGIFATLLARVARRRGAEARRVADGAVGLLWRGTWPCNVLDLLAVAERLGAASATPYTQAAVASAIAAIGLEPVARLASREPRPRDVAGALWCTRTAGGRVNKARAAGWLGWDADTLAARLVDLGLIDLAAVGRALGGGQEEGPVRAARDGSPEEALPPSVAPPGAGGRRGSNRSKDD